MIEAAFWDCDNTLVQSEPLHWRKHVDTCKEYGIELDPVDDRHFIHQSRGVEIYNWLVKEKSLKETQENYLNKVDAIYKSLMPSIQLAPHIAETLEYLKSKNIPQAIVSNGRNDPVNTALNAAKIANYFDAIVTYEVSPIGKPHPDPCLIGLKMLEDKLGRKLTAANCIFVDDLDLGVTAGKAAGMIAIHAPPPFLPIPSDKADHVITTDHSLLDLCRTLCGD
ncbi:MAG: HAD hydrolase-like protein [Alphaproteobacteria bacterium]|nr:HAD hydrolase-like protein [Alphaproteobacteria bacterium]